MNGPAWWRSATSTILVVRIMSRPGSACDDYDVVVSIALGCIHLRSSCTNHDFSKQARFHTAVVSSPLGDERERFVVVALSKSVVLFSIFRRAPIGGRSRFAGCKKSGKERPSVLVIRTGNGFCVAPHMCCPLLSPGFTSKATASTRRTSSPESTSLYSATLL